MMRARIAAALAEDCDRLVIENEPGGATERNALRFDFRVAFTQVVFARA